MRNILLPVVALIISTSVMNAYAINGDVKFSGEIVESTCTVTSSDQNKNVYIGKYPTSTFDKTGAVSSSKAFTISLEKCESGDYSLRFDGQTVANNPDLLSVNGGASGIGIEILTTDEKILSINKDSNKDSTWTNVVASDSKDGTATFYLKARYRSFMDTVSAGKADANATFTIEYK